MNNTKEIIPAKTQKELEIQWDERYETFLHVYEAFSMRRLKLYGAMRESIDLGWTKQMIEELIEEINSELHIPVKHKVLRAEVLSQLDRLYNQHSPNKSK